MSRVPIRVLAFVIGVVAIDQTAWSQHYLVRTEAVSRSGETAANFAVAIDLDDSSARPPSVSLSRPGTSVTADTLTTDGSYLWVLDDGTVHEILLDTAERTHVEGRSGSKRVLVGKRPDGHAPALLRYRESNAKSVLETFSPRGSAPTGRATMSLPGAPVDFAVLDVPGHYAALCQAADKSIGIAFITTEGDATSVGVVPIPSEPSQRALAPTRILPYLDGALAILAGFDMNRRSGQEVTWLYRANFPQSTLTQAVSLPGTVDAVVRSGPQRYWVVTTAEGGERAVAALVYLGESDLRIDTTLSLPASGSRVLAEVSENGEAVAFGAGDVLQVWQNDGTPVGTRQFSAPIGAVKWHGNRILLGEGGRFHEISARRLTTLRSIQLQNGHVRAIHTLSSAAQAFTDQDADGLIEAIDPQPLVATPRPAHPKQIVLHADKFGSEHRTFRIGDADFEGFPWQLVLDSPEIDTLMIDPPAGVLPGAVELRLAKESAAADAPKSIPLTLRLGPSSAGNDTMNLPLKVIVVPPSMAKPRMLWIPAVPTDPDDESALPRALRKLPIDTGLIPIDVVPFPESGELSQYDVIGVSLEAALNGQVSRRALVEAVGRGAGLILVGVPDFDTRIAELNRWLNPFQLTVQPARAIVRAERAPEHCDLCRVWSAASLGNALLATAPPPAEAHLMKGRETQTGPLVTLPMGVGRVAFVATEALVGATDENASLRTAMGETVGWLLRTRREVNDADMDGLADAIEDRNANGKVDPGETDPWASDTDADQLPDGMEDANGNGRYDPGETDPRQWDSDGDGISDAADAN